MAAVKSGTSVPVVDVSEFLAGGDAAPAAAAVRRACEHVGFFQVTGHGVPQHLLDAVVASMERLVALPGDGACR
jgi:isopenicillin N synthase-like dioxygenase